MATGDDGQRPPPAAADGQLARTRERLAEAALEVFGRKGYADTRVEDICQAAGSARATFYRHFSGKEDVYDTLLQRLVADLDHMATRVEAVTPDADGLATLRVLVGEWMTVAERWAPVVEAVSIPRRVPDESWDRAVVGLVEMSRVLGRAIAEGGGGYGDPRLEGLALIGLMEGFGHQLHTWDVAVERRAVLDAVALLSLRMLHPDLDPAAPGLTA